MLDLAAFARLSEMRGKTRTTPQGQIMYVVPASDPAVMFLARAAREIRGWSHIRGDLVPLQPGLLAHAQAALH